MAGASMAEQTPTQSPALRLYLVGAMPHFQEQRFPDFDAQAARLRALGYEVASPAELDYGPHPTWTKCMRQCLKVMLDCDAVVLIPGWEDSAGAHLELHLASRVGLVVMQAGEVTQ